MLEIAAFVVIVWLLCVSTAYLMCRETYQWSKKKSILVSCVAFPAVFFIADLRDLETLYKNDWKLKPDKPSPKRVRYKERMM